MTCFMLQISSDDNLPILYDVIDAAVNDFCNDNREECCQSLVNIQ